MRHVKWSCDWNRPLSDEERDIAKRLGNAPASDLAPTAEGFHSPSLAPRDQETEPKKKREWFDVETAP